jgi:hypothetical protein
VGTFLSFIIEIRRTLYTLKIEKKWLVLFMHHVRWGENVSIIDKRQIPSYSLIASWVLTSSSLLLDTITWQKWSPLWHHWQSTIIKSQPWRSWSHSKVQCKNIYSCHVSSITYWQFKGFKITWRKWSPPWHKSAECNIQVATPKVKDYMFSNFFWTYVWFKITWHK